MRPWVLALFVATMGVAMSGCASLGPWQASGGAVFKCRIVRSWMGFGKDRMECRTCRDKAGKFITCESDKGAARDLVPQEVSVATVWPEKR